MANQSAADPAQPMSTRKAKQVFQQFKDVVKRVAEAGPDDLNSKIKPNK